MYKVFVNDIPIILSSKEDFGEKYEKYSIKTVDFKKLVKRVAKGKLRYVHLYHRKEKKLLKHLLKKLPVVIAAGGLVYNDNGEILFIYRNKRWDLPKGKTEKNESLEDSAIREVEEETGVKDLKITGFLQKTYHIFKRKGKYKLKVTYWYQMHSSYTGELIPEQSEGIEKVKWKNAEKSRKALQKSYANIRLLFPAEFLAGNAKNRVA